jgi:hypothetical protein
VVKLLVLVTLSGCAQLLGLDNTHFDYKDGAVDAASVCDGVPANCVSTTGRSVCGRLVDTGSLTQTQVRAATFTGAQCSQVTPDAPCALSVFGQPAASYFSGNGADQITGTIDDCGRFVVPDLPPDAADVAIVFTGAPIVQSATLVIGRMTGAGALDPPIVGTIVRTETEMTWASQIDSATPPGLTGSYIIDYTTTSSDPIIVRIDGGALKTPPTQPWGVYFTGRPFEAVDKAATGTSPDASSALVVPAAGMHLVDGRRNGKTCSSAMIQPVGSAVVHITLKC